MKLWLSLRSARYQRAACALLVTLFVLGSLFPQFGALLPRDEQPQPAGRAYGHPVLWFPLAYALSGVPAGPLHLPPAPHAQLQGLPAEQPALPVLPWTDPALPALVLALLAPPALLAVLPPAQGLRFRPPDLCTFDPPPRAWVGCAA